MNIIEKMEDYEAAPWDEYHGAVPWDETYDPGPDLPEEQAEWDAVVPEKKAASDEAAS